MSFEIAICIICYLTSLADAHLRRNTVSSQPARCMKILMNAHQAPSTVDDNFLTVSFFLPAFKKKKGSKLTLSLIEVSSSGGSKHQYCASNLFPLARAPVFQSNKQTRVHCKLTTHRAGIASSVARCIGGQSGASRSVVPVVS